MTTGGVVSERIFRNHCRAWSRLPYRRGRCSRCTGTLVGEIRVCCGDCEQFPCACGRAEDHDLWIRTLADHDTPAEQLEVAA
ncbi:hypothetical protein GR927_20600 [Mycolicibacterium sp. 3033]|nr:hypothetical protein [Mycolicibacterium aurantiacum]